MVRKDFLRSIIVETIAIAIALWMLGHVGVRVWWSSGV